MGSYKDWKDKNQELINIIAYAVVSVVIIAIIISILIYGYSLTQNTAIVIDIASGKEINEKNLGAVNDWKLSLIGFEDSSADYEQDAYVEMMEVIQNYFSIIHPKGKKISYQKDSWVANDEIKKFKVKIADTYDYTIQTKEDENQKISLIIKEGNSKIYEYTSGKYELKKQSPTAIDSYLPYVGKTDNGDSYTVIRRKNDKKLEIAVDSCGDAEIKANALKHFQAWLDRNNFNVSEFSFIMPNYCDSNSGE